MGSEAPPGPRPAPPAFTLEPHLLPVRPKPNCGQASGREAGRVVCLGPRRGAGHLWRSRSNRSNGCTAGGIGRDPSPAPGRQRRPAGDHPARPRLTLVIEQPPDPGEENSHPRAAEALQPPGLRLRGRRTRRGLRHCSRALRAPASRDPRGGRSPGRPATREAPPLPPRRSPGSRTSPPRCLLEPRGPPSSPSSSPVAAGAGAGRGQCAGAELEAGLGDWRPLQRGGRAEVAGAGLRAPGFEVPSGSGATMQLCSHAHLPPYTHFQKSQVGAPTTVSLSLCWACSPLTEVTEVVGLFLLCCFLKLMQFFLALSLHHGSLPAPFSLRSQATLG